MRPRAALLALVPLLGAAIVAGGGGASAATTLWPTYHLDPGRSGNDPSEPSFNNLSTAWTSRQLDGAIYAEPLVDGNLVIVGTENNSLYAFNATTGAPVWGPINPFGAARTTFPPPCGNIMPLGITGTPVIDGGFLYAVGDVQITSLTFQWHLAKVNPSTGAVSYATDITPPPGGNATMDTNLQQERAALAVSNGNIVVTWGALSEDCGQYHGYVVTASESTGAVQAQWNDTYEISTSRGGGIWGTSGAAVDSSGNIYVSTGNGSATTITGYAGDYGDSVIKLSPSLSVLSWFAPGPPESWLNSNVNDVDLGSAGPALLPNGLLFAIGKGGLGYLLNQSALPMNSNPGGGENFSAQVCHATQDAAYGGNAVRGSVVFVPCSDGLAAINIDSSTHFHTIWYASKGGASPIVAGGLVWTMQTFGGTSLYGLRPDTGAVAATLTLPATSQHFATPAAGDGMLFVGAGSQVVAFRPPPATTSVVSSSNPSAVGQSVTYTATVSPTPDGGTMSFTDNGATITGCAAVVVSTSTGRASCTTTYGAVGSHTIVAGYSGDSNYAAASGSLIQRVNQSNPTSYVLDGWGGLHPYGGAPAVTVSAYWKGVDIARGLALDHCAGQAGGYVLDAWGGVHPFGGAPAVSITAYWPNWDLARSIAATCINGSPGGYVLDAWGGIHPFGSASPASISAYWQGWDIARGIVVRSTGQGGYVLDGWGGVHPFGGASAVSVSGYWKNWDIARGIVLQSTGQGGYVLDGWGGVHPFGGAAAVSVNANAYWKNWDIARGLVLRSDTSGYVLDGWGGVHSFGGAAGATVSAYWPTWDIARGITP